MNTDELVEKLGKVIDQKLEPINKKLDGLERGVKEQGTAIREQGNIIAQIKTGVEALAAGQHDTREQVKTLSGKVATKVDVQDIKTDLVKHQRRIENLEKDAVIPNPHKN